MDIKRNGSRPSTNAPEAYFSGAVRVEPVFQVGEPVRLNGGSVTFEPGARTAWHTHHNGDIYVGDGHGIGTNERIVKFSKEGKFIKAWAKHGNAVGEIDTPHGIALDSAGGFM